MEATGTDLKDINPVQAPEVMPDLGLAVRPKRKCAMNKYFIENYVLQSTKIVPKLALANERRSFSATSKRKAKAKSPLITTFLKPKVASPEGVRNDTGEPKEAVNKSQSDSSVSQKLMSDFFPKN